MTAILQINPYLFFTLWESIPRLFNEGRTTMTTRCASACSQALPVKPQGVWARGIEAWAGHVTSEIWCFGGGGSSGPPSLMKLGCCPCPIHGVGRWHFPTKSDGTNPLGKPVFAKLHRHISFCRHYLLHGRCWGKIFCIKFDQETSSIN